MYSYYTLFGEQFTLFPLFEKHRTNIYIIFFSLLKERDYLVR